MNSSFRQMICAPLPAASRTSRSARATFACAIGVGVVLDDADGERTHSTPDSRLPTPTPSSPTRLRTLQCRRRMRAYKRQATEPATRPLTPATELQSSRTRSASRCSDSAPSARRSRRILVERPELAASAAADPRLQSRRRRASAPTWMPGVRHLDRRLRRQCSSRRARRRRRGRRRCRTRRASG